VNKAQKLYKVEFAIFKFTLNQNQFKVR